MNASEYRKDRDEVRSHLVFLVAEIATIITENRALRVTIDTLEESRKQLMESRKQLMAEVTEQRNRADNLLGEVARLTNYKQLYFEHVSGSWEAESDGSDTLATL